MGFLACSTATSSPSTAIPGTPGRFLAEARSRGAGHAYLHQLFADLIGPLDPDGRCAAPSRSPAGYWPICLPRARSHLATTPLMGLARGAGALRLGRLESWAYDLARDVEYRVGVMQSLASPMAFGAANEAPEGPGKW